MQTSNEVELFAALGKRHKEKFTDVLPKSRPIPGCTLGSPRHCQSASCHTAAIRPALGPIASMIQAPAISAGTVTGDNLMANCSRLRQWVESETATMPVRTANATGIGFRPSPTPAAMPWPHGQLFGRRR